MGFFYSLSWMQTVRTITKWLTSAFYSIYRRTFTTTKVLFRARRVHSVSQKCDHAGEKLRITTSERCEIEVRARRARLHCCTKINCVITPKSLLLLYADWSSLLRGWRMMVGARWKYVVFCVMKWFVWWECSIYRLYEYCIIYSPFVVASFEWSLVRSR